MFKKKTNITYFNVPIFYIYHLQIWVNLFYIEFVIEIDKLSKIAIRTIKEVYGI